jgi:hypothetical protein
VAAVISGSQIKPGVGNVVEARTQQEVEDNRLRVKTSVAACILQFEDYQDKVTKTRWKMTSLLTTS